MALFATLTGIAAAGAQPAPANKVNYYYPENWLCRPDHNEACEVDLSTTVIDAQGKTSLKRFSRNPQAPIDCFYVYPTVSEERGPISDLNEGRAERDVVRQQFAPFGSKCRLYAPLYHQVTLSTLASEARGVAPNFDPLVPARDVINAWKTYVGHDNAGRGFVLIGHSQGAAILKYIVAGLIEGTPLARQLVSVIIPGTDIDVPKGESTGGTFASIQLCRTADETGCVIVYSSYPASDPPGANASFGMSARPGMQDGCVNPARLATGGTTLDAFLPATGVLKTRNRTPFLAVPGLLSGECTFAENHNFLAISIAQDRRAPKVQQFLRAVVAQEPTWGLHAMDINLALGDLIGIVGTETDAWLARNQPVAEGSTVPH
ncbi:MAG TPA: DUF3089 domain-containing protein [Stellaceae bacterium]|nr:DUF3089 domain-containing protein [Stellaceae bacterium]